MSHQSRNLPPCLAGQTLAEYALILALIAIVVLIGLLFLGSAQPTFVSAS